MLLLLGVSCALILEYGGIVLFLYVSDIASNRGVLALGKIGAWTCFVAIVATCIASFLH